MTARERGGRLSSLVLTSRGKNKKERQTDRKKERKCCSSAFKHVGVERVEGWGGDAWAKWPKAVGRQRWGEVHTCLKVLQIMKGKKRRAGVCNLHTFPSFTRTGNPSKIQVIWSRVGEDRSRERTQLSPGWPRSKALSDAAQLNRAHLEQQGFIY